MRIQINSASGRSLPAGHMLRHTLARDGLKQAGRAMTFRNKRFGASKESMRQ